MARHSLDAVPARKLVREVKKELRSAVIDLDERYLDCQQLVLPLPSQQLHLTSKGGSEPYD